MMRISYHKASAFNTGKPITRNTLKDLISDDENATVMIKSRQIKA